MPPVSQAKRREEVLPFGVASLGRQIASETGKLFLLEPEDPVLARLAHENPHRLYQRLGITDATVAGAWSQIVTCLLAYPIDLLPASSKQGYGREPSRAQRRMHRYVQSAIDQVTMWETVLCRALDAVAWGWRPFEITYDRDLYVMGTRYWRPVTMREKDPSLFRFNGNRDLVLVATRESMIFDGPDDPARWWLCQSGSLDCPYGIGLFQPAWLPSYLKSQYLTLWKAGLTRQNGVLRVKSSKPADVNLTNPSTAVSPRQTVSAVVAAAREMMRAVNEDGILVTMNGFEASFEEGLTASADTFQGPISYLDGLINLVLLGQQLTAASAKDTSSRAAGEVARKTTIDRARGVGGSLVGMLNVLVGMLCRLNFGDDADPADFPYWRSQIDRTSKLDAAAKLFAMGAIIDGNQLAEDSGVPLLKEGEPGALQKTAATADLTVDSATQGDPQNTGDAATGEQDAASG